MQNRVVLIVASLSFFEKLLSASAIRCKWGHLVRLQQQITKFLKSALLWIDQSGSDLDFESVANVTAGLNTMKKLWVT